MQFDVMDHPVAVIGLEMCCGGGRSHGVQRNNKNIHTSRARCKYVPLGCDSWRELYGAAANAAAGVCTRL